MANESDITGEKSWSIWEVQKGKKKRERGMGKRGMNIALFRKLPVISLGPLSDLNESRKLTKAGN